jgi:signal transduction histidine kinase
MIKKEGTKVSNKKCILIADMSRTVQQYFKNIIAPIGYEIYTAETSDDIKTIINKNKNIDIAIISMDMDCDVEAIVDVMLKKNIATILLSGSEDSALRDKLKKKDIIDCVKKISTCETHAVVNLLNRLNENKQKTILVVDDSTIFRSLMKNLLHLHLFNVIEANDGQEALKIVKMNKAISLVVTDYEMPKLNGLGFIKGVRKLYNTNELPIIVISGVGSHDTITDCMKNGANDYLHKPFGHEEFYSRLNLTLLYKENIALLKKEKEKYAELSKSLEKQVLQEVNKNKQQASQMLQQSRLAQSGEMISMIAHQWRQPLASISAISSTLTLDILMDEYKADFFQERLESISELSQHLSSTIDDFRNFFKEDKTKQRVKLNSIVDGCIQIIEPTLITKDIELIVELDNDITVFTYASEAKQVVLNILKNAEDIFKEKKLSNSIIRVRTYLENNKANLIIEDNAGGVPKEIIEKIFDPYFSTKKSKNGTGLGLYMSKTIIKEHCNGELSVENTKHGAKFIITFPLDDKEGDRHE